MIVETKQKLRKFPHQKRTIELKTMKIVVGVYSIIVSKLSKVNTSNFGFLFFFWLHRVKQMLDVRKLKCQR